jgi:hypothetical protein
MLRLSRCIGLIGGCMKIVTFAVNSAILRGTMSALPLDGSIVTSYNPQSTDPPVWDSEDFVSAGSGELGVVGALPFALHAARTAASRTHRIADVNVRIIMTFLQDLRVDASFGQSGNGS